MSNQQVGPVFDRVIQDVCDASQVDFEESGVDQQTLLDLRMSWQKKLSSLGVAQFPWDPSPPPQLSSPQSQNQILPHTATVPSNAPRPSSSIQSHHVQRPLHQPLLGTTAPLQAPFTPHSPMDQIPRVKTEPNANGQPGMSPMQSIMPTSLSNSQSARERAASMLHQRYGAAAANSVSQLQAQSQPALGYASQMRLQHTQPHNGQDHSVKTEPSYSSVSSLGNTQTDGAGDALSEWKAEAARRREAAAKGQDQYGESSRLLREHFKYRMQQLEGGGLLLPLEKQQLSPLKSGLPASESASIIHQSVPLLPTIPSHQFDGPNGNDEKEEDDEDAINSDLDDPEDLVGDENDGEDSVGQVMLCTYDKVQRVKNKWKCTLKDGILTTGGKEYVFHKGQGEFEW